MTRTDRPAMPIDALPPSAEASELARAAADLEALADAYDRCARDLDAIESAVDTLLDDDALCALLLDEQRRVVAVSRGMARALGVERSVLGGAVATVLPPDWPDLAAALDDLTRDEGWRSLPVGDDGTALRIRRATDDDSPGMYVVRYVPCG